MPRHDAAPGTTYSQVFVRAQVFAKVLFAKGVVIKGVRKAVRRVERATDWHREYLFFSYIYMCLHLFIFRYIIQYLYKCIYIYICVYINMNIYICVYS